MRAYASLVPDEKLREAFLGMILDEFRRTQDAVRDLFHGDFIDRRPRMARTLDIREEPLRVLHMQQVSLLREWRSRLAKGDESGAEMMIPDLLISVNAPAARKPVKATAVASMDLILFIERFMVWAEVWVLKLHRPRKRSARATPYGTVALSRNRATPTFLYESTT